MYLDVARQQRNQTSSPGRILHAVVNLYARHVVHGFVEQFADGLSVLGARQPHLLRADRIFAAQPPLQRGGAEVFDLRRGRLGHDDLRHELDLRHDRQFGLRARFRPASLKLQSTRWRCSSRSSSSWRVSATRSSSCRSTCGRPTSIRARRRRSPRSCPLPPMRAGLAIMIRFFFPVMSRDGAGRRLDVRFRSRMAAGLAVPQHDHDDNRQSLRVESA